jgi:hypothetical protein
LDRIHPLASRAAGVAAQRKKLNEAFGTLRPVKAVHTHSVNRPYAKA